MNLVELTELLTGFDYQTRNQIEWCGPCPYCKTGVDRFHIWPFSKVSGDFWCRVCNEKGGAIKLAMKITGKDYRESILYLREVNYSSEIDLDRQFNYTKEKLPPPTKSSECRIDLDCNVIELYHKNGRLKALEYLKQWGLSLKSVDKFMFGWSEEKNALTIPHWWIEDNNYYLKSLKFRHMTTEIRKRFSQIKGGSLSGFWNVELISNPDGSRDGPTLPYLLILEAEKDAALLTELGYYAVSYLRDNRWNDNINQCLKNIELPIIIADVDPKRQGLTSALQVQSYIKSHSIIHSTEKLNIKSPSDLAKRDGIEAIHDWFKGLHI